MSKLTFVKISNAKGPAVLHDGQGLYLRVSNTGAKNWIFRYQLDGRRRDMGLGRFPDVGLAEARQRATERRALCQSGIDPLTVKATQRQARAVAAARQRTFRDVAEEYMALRQGEWRNAKHREQWRQSLATYAFPVIGHLPVADIDVGLVLKVIEPLWADRAHLGDRLRGRIEAVLDAASVRGYRTGTNPAQWRGNLAHILPARAKVHQVIHHPALPFTDLPEFIAELRQQGGVAALALQFLILTATRLSETTNACWGEIDLANKMWSIPAARMKMRNEHRIPLSDAALAVLDHMRLWALSSDPASPVFPGIRPAIPISGSALRAVLIRMGRKAEATVHGYRATFSSWAAENTSHPYEVREMALGHTVGTVVERSYQRSTLFERRRRLMDDWARFCEAPATGDVVPLRRAR